MLALHWVGWQLRSKKMALFCLCCGTLRVKTCWQTKWIKLWCVGQCVPLAHRIPHVPCCPMLPCGDPGLFQPGPHAVGQYGGIELSQFLAPHTSMLGPILTHASCRGTGNAGPSMEAQGTRNSLGPAPPCISLIEPALSHISEWSTCQHGS